VATPRSSFKTTGVYLNKTPKILKPQVYL